MLAPGCLGKQVWESSPGRRLCWTCPRGAGPRATYPLRGALHRSPSNLDSCRKAGNVGEGRASQVRRRLRNRWGTCRSLEVDCRWILTAGWLQSGDDRSLVRCGGDETDADRAGDSWQSALLFDGRFLCTDRPFSSTVSRCSPYSASVLSVFKLVEYDESSKHP